MVRPPMFSRCGSVGRENISQMSHRQISHRQDKADACPHHAPLSPPLESGRRLTAGGIAAIILMAVFMLFISALIGMLAGLAPASAADGAPRPGLDVG